MLLPDVLLVMERIFATKMVFPSQVSSLLYMCDIIQVKHFILLYIESFWDFLSQNVSSVASDADAVPSILTFLLIVVPVQHSFT